ncbi:MAG: NAD(P)-dependent alcohol dehydrogenase [Paracoccaceae bacterium]
MKAAVYHRYGGPEVVQIADLPQPQPGAGEVLVRIVTTTVSTADWRLRSLDVPRGFRLPVRLMFGWNAPRKPVLGTELAGVVVQVGAGVTRFSPGDEVVAFVGAGLGCHAEYRLVSETAAIIRKPAALSWEEAGAMCFGGATALWFLGQKMVLRPGERLLVIGASGAVGSAAVQIGRAFGAHVTGMARQENHELLGRVGIDEVRDYRTFIPTDDPLGFDAILDVAGKTPPRTLAQALRPGGRLGMVLGDLPLMLQTPFLRLGDGKHVITGTAPERPEDLAYLAQMAEQGLFRPVVGSVTPLERIADAHRITDTGHKQGSAVVRVAPDPAAQRQAA